MLGKLFKSKTVIVNTLMVVGGVVGYLAGHDVIVAHPEWVSALVAASGVINVVLRIVTTIPIWEK